MDDFEVAMSIDYIKEAEESFNNSFESWNQLLDMYRQGEITVNQINSALKCVAWLEGILPKKIDEYNFLAESRRQEDPEKSEHIRRSVAKKNKTQLAVSQTISEHMMAE